MWPFRRKAGRHELGAAVTGIPGMPQAAQPVAVAAVPVWARPPAAPVPVSADRDSAHELLATPEPLPAALVAEVPPAPRVELGFRDGSTAALAPGSDQAKALSEIASVLTQRD